MEANKSSHQLLRHLRIQIDGLALLLLRQALTRCVGHVDRAWTQQQRFSPVCQRGNIGREGGNHGRQSFDSLEPAEKEFRA